MTLDDAWAWYLKTRNQLRLFGRLGKAHRDGLPPESSIWKDERFKQLDSGAIEEASNDCLDPLDDFAVFILFSVFEASVRDFVLSEIRRERTLLRHRLLTGIVDEAIRGFEEGSFFRVLEVFKTRDANLVEQVNQVRQYRNWVAHGRRTARPEAVVEPEAAYGRLSRFLDRRLEPVDPR